MLARSPARRLAPAARRRCGRRRQSACSRSSRRPVQPASSSEREPRARASARAQVDVLSARRHGCHHGRPDSRRSAISICSGRVASIHGPPRSSTEPRTRTRRPSSCFGSRPAAAKAALVAFQNRDGEILGPAPPEVDIDRAAAFAHRQHLALDQREPAPQRPGFRAAFSGVLRHDSVGFAQRPRPARPRGRFGRPGTRPRSQCPRRCAATRAWPCASNLQLDRLSPSAARDAGR